MRALIWFRNDLRVHDHAPLTAAARADVLVALHVLDPRGHTPTPWGFARAGALRLRFLRQSLHALRDTLRQRGNDLLLREGAPEDIIPELVRRHALNTVLCYRQTGTEEADDEARLRRALPAGVRLQTFEGQTLLHPDDLPFPIEALPEVFTTFRKAVERGGLEVRPPLPAPGRLPPLPDGLSPGDPDEPAREQDEPAAGEPDQPGGERAALARLHAYVWDGDHLRRYKATRNGLLGRWFSSRLSPYLATGALSPRQVVAEVRRYEAERVRNESTYWLVFELLWRDYFHFWARKHGRRLFFRGGPAGRPRAWRQDEDAFRRWCEGRTGYPFVDAALRELRATGWMSNRARQNVASFLARSLGLDWRMGAAWFEHHLIDYDVASNWGNWAYVAGVGTDPRDRTFNVLRQADRYDPDGAYARHWVPEVAGVPGALVHRPFDLTPMERTLYAVDPAYPPPLVPPSTFTRARR
ncbi:MAG: cryptochrome DASH [Rhodothermaceae bacterium]|nr:MAG: cryptochrome DASH [Rhodothermaceae bacterium]